MATRVLFDKSRPVTDYEAISAILSARGLKYEAAALPGNGRRIDINLGERHWAEMFFDPEGTLLDIVAESY